MRVGSIGIALGILLPLHSHAQDVRSDLPPSVITNMITQPGINLDTSGGVIRRAFRLLDANSDGRLDESDAKMHEALTVTGFRASNASAFMIADIDGDGYVSEAELRAKRGYDMRSQDMTPGHVERIEQEIRKLKEADADRDGRVSWAEAAAMPLPRDTSEMFARGLPGQVRELVSFAGPDKGPLDLAQLTSLVAPFLKSVDTDGNGVISSEELAVLQARVGEQRRREAEAAAARRAAEARAECVMPKASAGAKVVLLSAYESDSVSTSTIGSQDVSIGAGSITVEPGTEPLYVVVLSHRGVIWQFSGATERLERVVLGAANTGPNSGHPDAKPLVGATGISAEKIMFIPKTKCLGYFSERPSSQAASTAAIVSRETGKEPTISARYAVSGFSIPSGEIKYTSEAGRPRIVISKSFGNIKIDGDADVVIQTGMSNLLSEALRFHPGGVVEIDPTTVVAAQPAAKYDVLPNQFGLMQLVQKGALTRNRSGEFLIKEKIRYPAELFGAHSVRFLLLKGVAEPDGNPGHSCVISEETGAPVGKSSTCR